MSILASMIRPIHVHAPLRRGRSRPGGPLHAFILVVLTLAAPWAVADPRPDYSRASLQQLVDALVDIDAQTVGLHSTLRFRTFIADGSPEDVLGGIFSSPAPRRFPQMVELVRRGAAALPVLMAHLDDTRETRLIVGRNFFSSRVFRAEYDFRYRPIPSASTAAARQDSGRPFYQSYTVKVGDVCFVLIGQIVNRRLQVLRFQAPATLVVNSPIESPALIDAVRQDWSGTSPAALMASLLNDARAGEPSTCGPALQRLRFYYPAEYRRQAAGALQERILAFESYEHSH